MNIQCPHCQKMLTVPEEFAGQAMMCPLCRGQFTMPALPAGGTKPPAGGPASPPPPPETFTLRLPPSGAFQAPGQAPGQATPPAAPGKEPEALAPVMAAGTGEYRHAIPLRFNPVVLRWFVPLALILVFVLLFFTWETVSPAGKDLFTQSGWQTAFGGWSVDPSNMELLSKAQLPVFPDVETERPGSSILMIFFIILVCFGLLFALATMVFNLLPGLQVPIIQRLRSMQGIILGGLALVAFILLAIQVAVGFPMDRKITQKVDTALKNAPDTPEGEVQRLSLLAMMNIHHTFWYRLAFCLIFLAFLGGLMEFWTRRRANRPYPKIEFAW